MPPRECYAQVARLGPLWYSATGGGGQSYVGRSIPGEPEGEFPQEFRRGFQTPFEGTLSITIFHVMPEVHLKLRYFRSAEAFEMTDP